MFCLKKLSLPCNRSNSLLQDHTEYRVKKASAVLPADWRGGIIGKFLPPPPADWRGTPSLDELGTGSILGGDNRVRLYFYSLTIPLHFDA